MKTKNEKLRIALLNAGKNEFLAHGYRAVSIRNIATKAGATTGAIYVYFENKEGLFHALVKDTAQELLAFWRQMAARSTRIVRNGGGYVNQIPCEDKVWLEEFLYKLCTFYSSKAAYEWPTTILICTRFSGHWLKNE